MRKLFTLFKHLVIPSLTVRNAPALADEAAERKARSFKILQAEGVLYINNLPVIGTAEESLRRTEEEVIRRLIALAIVSVKGETGDHSLGQNLVIQFGAKGFFTSSEQAFMDDTSPSGRDRAQFAWRYEAVHVLLWAIGITNDLGHPSSTTNVPLLASTLRDLGTDGLRNKAWLRPQAEMLDAADLIYRYHWAIVDARVNGGPVSSSLDPGVVYERHYTLNWLIGYAGQEWDDISTDT